MIEEFRAKNYGCLRDVTIKLTPLHALIGPNDSGKSTLLYAVKDLVQSFVVDRYTVDTRFQRDAELVAITPTGTVSVHAPDEKHSPLLTTVRVVDGQLLARPLERDAFQAKFGSVQREINGARLVRFDPEALRTESGLIPESESVVFADEHGVGLPGVYLAILSRGDEVFRAIVDDVRRHFPTVKNVRVPAVSKNSVALEVELHDDQRVPAKHMSEGLLYYLAFAVLPHIAPVSVLLVEEPENGLHPARIAEIVRVLRKVSESGTQVLMATHSPLVINELHPEEVTVVTRSLESGTKLTPIKDTPNFSKRSSVYALGELWLSYANGVDEAPLLEGGPR